MKDMRHALTLAAASLALALFSGAALAKDGWQFSGSPAACSASTNERGWSASFLIKKEAPKVITLEFESKFLYPGLRAPQFAKLHLRGAGKSFGTLFASRGPGGLIMEFQRTADLKTVLGLSGWFEIVSGAEPPQEVLIPGDVANVLGRLEQCLSKRS